MHHHRIFFDKYHPGYFGKVGMRYFHKLRNKFYCPIININKLWSLIPEDVKAKTNKDSAPMIDICDSVWVLQSPQKGCFSRESTHRFMVGVLCFRFVLLC
ncbi:Ribosomal protein L18e/L15P [Corchorus olitorius]|uniref:Ribosomal protein L18e/L15P n=1 Tax=Corchorus olitorius TaxID=93759 RepID=A0A1R3JI38_9ROSI|nr:Ribosomal protein L18e/L15P [Corchorus olitorius]